MALTTLKEEARAEFRREYEEAYMNILSRESLAEGNAWFEDFIDKAIDRTYHATKKEVRGIAEAIINDTKMEYITQKDVLTYQGKPLSTLLGSEKNYVSAVDLDAMLQRVLVALEDTATSPNH